jgi:hypothetical protein
MPKRAHDGSESKLSLRKYISGAATIVASINDDENDLRFVDQQGGRIIYLIDANVLLFCLRPEREARLIEMLPLKERYVRLGIAELASIHIVNAAFSGQRQSGPLFLLGPHIREVNRQLEGLVEELEAGHLDEGAKKERAGSLKRYSDWRRSDRVASLEGSIWYTEVIRNQIARRSGKGQSKGRDQLGHGTLSDLILKAVEDHYQAEAGQSTQGDARAPFAVENAKADVSVLLDLIELNSIFGSRPQPVRFCLITADRRLHHAVATLFYSNEQIGRSGVTFRQCCSETLPTRFIGQYHPTLSMDDDLASQELDISFKSVFHETLTAFGYRLGQSDVLHFYAGPNRFHPLFWAWYGDIGESAQSRSLNDDLPHNVPFGRMAKISIEAGLESWAKANELTVRANRDKLDAHRIVTENERRAAFKDISNVLVEFEVQNFSLLLNYYCWSYLHSIQASRSTSTGSGARFGMPTSFDFGILTNDRSMESFIASLGLQDVIDTVPMFIEKLGRPDTDDVVRRLCLGCLALGVAPGASDHDDSTHGSIRVAQELFLEVARRLGATDLTPEKEKVLLASNAKAEIAIEALHLLGFAQRIMAICEMDAMVQMTGRAFDRQLAEAEKHVLAARSLASAVNFEMSVWRADSEAAALACTRLLYHLRASRSLSRGPAVRVQPEALQHLASEASTRLDAVLRHMLDRAVRERVTGSIRLKDAKDRQRLYDDVLLQSLTNSLCYQWLSCGCGQALPQLDRKRLTLALEEVEMFQDGRHVAPSSFSVSNINYLAACASIGRKPVAEDDALVALRDLARRADTMALDANSNLPLTKLDLDELRYLASPAFADSVRRFARPSAQRRSTT